jgi:group II intron reverse transcriptase/maturase
MELLWESWDGIILTKRSATVIRLKDLADTSLLERQFLSCKSSSSAAGVDKITPKEFDKARAVNIRALSDAILAETWEPHEVLRVAIPKRSGGSRSIGVLCVEDRIVCGALRELLQPVIEPLLEDTVFAYRPGKGAKAAALRLKSAMTGTTAPRWIAATDIAHFFDSIPLDKLEQTLWNDARLDIDKEAMSLIGLVLRMQGSTPLLGLAQGSPLSPILSNYYLSRFDRGMIKKCHAYVRFCDNIVAMAWSSEEAWGIEKLFDEKLKDLGLEMKQEETLVRSIEEGFDWLGFHFEKMEPLLGLPVEGEILITASDRSIANLLDQVERFQDDPKRLLAAVKGWTGFYGTLSTPEKLGNWRELVAKTFLQIGAKKAKRESDLFEGLSSEPKTKDPWKQRSRSSNVLDLVDRIRMAVRGKKSGF